LEIGVADDKKIFFCQSATSFKHLRLLMYADRREPREKNASPANDLMTGLRPKRLWRFLVELKFEKTFKNL
jgi:hypothetical protein